MSLSQSIFATGFLLISLLFPFPISAHGSGSSFEQKIDQYLIDIGYEPEKIEVGKSAVFDFLLYEVDEKNPDDKKTVAFTDIWVRLSQDEKAVLATGLAKQRLGGTALTYTFYKPGEYDLFVRFQNEEGAIVETTIPVEVSGEPVAPEEKVEKQSFLRKEVFGLFFTFVGGLLAGYWWFRAKK